MATVVEAGALAVPAALISVQPRETEPEEPAVYAIAFEVPEVTPAEPFALVIVPLEIVQL
jgi:hypothetical protein